MEEPDDRGVPQRIMSLMALYADARRRREAAEEEMTEYRALIAELYGDDTVSVDLDDVRITYEVRYGNSRPNVAALRAAGYRMEQFSSVKPTMAALRQLAEQEEWDQSVIDKFVIPSGERRPVITMRKIDDEGGRYGTE